jgi:hypothetical protein
VFSLLSLLRRCQLWPVTAALLKATSAGKQVAVLRRHPHPQVSSLADEVVATWKASLARQAAAAAAAAVRKQGASAAAPSAATAIAAAAAQGGASDKGGSSRRGLAVDATLQSKVIAMLRDALMDHQRAVLAAAGTAAAGEAGVLPAGSSDTKPQLERARPGLHQLAQQLEQAVQQHLQQQAASAGAADGAATAAAAAATTTAAAAAASQEELLQAYKRRVRMLATGLRHADGVAPQLLVGERSVAEVGG